MTTNNRIADRERIGSASARPSEQVGVRVQQHTPGPWDYTEASGYVWGADEETKVCMVSFIPKRRDAMDANARLIAAAPEMLEALVMIHRIMIQRNMVEDEREVANQAWAAIQKARGGQ